MARIGLQPVTIGGSGEPEIVSAGAAHDTSDRAGGDAAGSSPARLDAGATGASNAEER